jgi:hypothetical protein
MKTRVTSVRLNETTLRALRQYCQAHGLKVGHFVEQAVRERLDLLNRNPAANGINANLLEDIVERLKRLGV